MCIGSSVKEIETALKKTKAPLRMHFIPPESPNDKQRKKNKQVQKDKQNQQKITSSTENVKTLAEDNGVQRYSFLFQAGKMGLAFSDGLDKAAARLKKNRNYCFGHKKHHVRDHQGFVLGVVATKAGANEVAKMK